MRNLQLFYAILFGILFTMPIGHAVTPNGTLNIVLTNIDLFLNNVKYVHVKIVKVEKNLETVIWESDDSLPLNFSISTSPGVYKVYIRKSNSTVIEYNDDSEGYSLLPNGEVTIPRPSSEGEVGIQFVNTVDTDVLSDGPWRLEPGKDIPITHIIKDTDEYNLYIRKIEIYNDDPPLKDDSGAGDTLVYTHTLEQLFTQDFWYSIDYLAPSLFNDGDASPGLEIHIKYDIAYELDVHKYFTTELANAPLPKLLNWYTGDTHYHSSYSDNKCEFGAPVEATVVTGSVVGLNWVTITDHSFDLTASEWTSLVSEANVYSTTEFKALPSEEVSAYIPGTNTPGLGDYKYNHFLAYGITNFVPGGEWEALGSDTNAYYTPSEVVDVVNSQGGFGHFAHPLDGDQFRDPLRDQDYSLPFAGLQVWNGILDSSGDINRLQRGINNWTKLLLTGRKVFVEAGTDAHGDFSHVEPELSPCDLKEYFFGGTNNAFGKVRTYVYTTDFSQTGILDALRNGHSIMTDGPLIVFDIGGAKIGDTTTVPQGDDFTLNIQGASSPEFGSTISYTVYAGIIGGSEVQVESGSFNAYTSGSTTETLNMGTDCSNQDCYIRIEATSSSGGTTYRAYTNPIWVEIDYSDSFEPDDTYSTATLIPTDGSTQTHNFHDAGDYDYIKFSATAGNNYTIQTSNLGSSSDTYIYLYDTDGTTLITSNDDYPGLGLASKIEWECLSSGTYYVRVKHSSSSTYGANTEYDISVTSEATGATPVTTCTTISSPGVYELQNDLTASSTCIRITSSDVTFDGQGHTIAGTGSWYGVYAYNSATTITNVIVKNLIATSWGTGIYYRSAENGTIANNTANNNSNSGIDLHYSNSNNLSGNTASNNNNDDGIFLAFSNDNTIANNTANNNSLGIFLYGSGNTLSGNTANNNSNRGIYIDYSSNTIANNTASNNGWSGIYLSPYSSSNSLSGNTATSNGIDGIALWNSNSNTLSGNTANNNNDDGIHLYSSNSSTIYNNTASNNNDAGIYLWSSRSNSIYNNYFNNTQNFEFNNAGSNDWNTTKTPGTNIINGSYLGGNFWATPSGTGFSQTCSDSDSDGICDSSYSLSSGNVDYLPLAKREKGTLWYFAEGYTGSGFNERLDILNPSGDTASVNITYMFGDGTTQEQSLSIASGYRETIDVNSVVGGGKDVSIKVESDRAVVAERPMFFTYGGSIPGAHSTQAVTSPSKVWYFAEGYTGSGFTEYLTLQNPNTSPASVNVTYMFGDGTTQEQSISVGGNTRYTINVNDVVGGGKEVSVKINSDQPIIAERPMYFTYGGSIPGGHVTVGATSLSKEWYFAEGYTGSGFTEYLTLQNPHSQPASVNITYMFGDGSTQVQQINIGATTRYTIRVNDEVGSGRDVSVKVNSDRGIVAERPMYFNYAGNTKGGHNTIGGTQPSKTWYFAAGETTGNTDEYVTIMNPDSSSTATVTVSYLFSNGTSQSENVTVSPTQRYTIKVNDRVGAGKDVSVKLESDVAVFAERPMYYEDWEGSGIDGGTAALGFAP